jgi:CRP-like cAMP-binding protein
MRVATPAAGRSVAAVNRLLETLPVLVRRSLHPSLERVRLTRGQLLAAPGAEVQYAYFPLRGVLVLLATGPDGETVQVGMVGPDGLVGTSILLRDTSWPYAVVAPVPGDAYRLRVSTLLSACERDVAVQRLLLGCAQHQLHAMAQASVCHRFHTVQQRLSGWLLAAARAASTDTLAVTQDLLAQVLGAPRTSVSRAATVLEDHGVIRQRHGRVRILQREGLRVRACACATGPDHEPSHRHASLPPRPFA